MLDIWRYRDRTLWAPLQPCIIQQLDKYTDTHTHTHTHTRRHTQRERRTNHGPVSRGQDFLGAWGQLHPGLLGLGVVGDDLRVVAGPTSDAAAVTGLLLQVADDGSLGQSSDGHHITHVQVSCGVRQRVSVSVGKWRYWNREWKIDWYGMIKLG